MEIEIARNNKWQTDQQQIWLGILLLFIYYLLSTVDEFVSCYNLLLIILTSVIIMV